MYDFICYTAWKQLGLVWVGGRLEDGHIWKWHRLSTSEINNLPWGANESNNNNYYNCVHGDK